MSTKSSFPPTDCRSCAIHHECVLGQLGEGDRTILRPHLRQRIFHRGDVLVEEGKNATVVRILKLGTVLAHHRGLDGHSRPIGVMSRGNAFGIFAMFDRPNQVSGIALTTVRVCEIPVAALRELSACGSQLLVQVIHAVVGNFASMAAWSEAMRIQGVVNQLAYVVILLADASRSEIVELPNQSVLADLLGTRRESVARALRTLDGEGGIHRIERKRCEVHRGKLLVRLTQARPESSK